MPDHIVYEYLTIHRLYRLYGYSGTGNGSHEKTKIFVTQPFKKWKNAIEKYNDHENC